MCHKLQPQLHSAPLSCKDNSPTAGERSMRAEAHVCEGLHAAKYYQKAPKRISWIFIWFSLVWMEITSGSILMITQFKNLKRPFRRLLNVHLFLCSTWETSVSETSQFLSIILWKLNWHWQRSLMRFCGPFVRNYFDVLFFFLFLSENSTVFTLLLLSGLFCISAESWPKSWKVFIQIQTCFYKMSKVNSPQISVAN